MREIKFRIWDTREKSWVVPEGFMLVDISVRMFEDGMSKEHTSLRLKEKGFIYCQYTGLKDKNGKEIYEGDIVESITGFAASSPGEVGVIKWYSYPPGFGVKWAYISNCRLAEEFLADIEVIGNIYENPELH